MGGGAEQEGSGRGQGVGEQVTQAAGHATPVRDRSGDLGRQHFPGQVLMVVTFSFHSLLLTYYFS